MKILFLPLAAAVLATASFGAVIAPTTATASSSIAAGRNLSQTIDGSDLTTTGPVEDWTHVVNSSNSGGYWLSASGGSLATLDFTFSTAQDLSKLYLWTYARGGENDRGIQTATITFSTDGTNFGLSESITVGQGNNNAPIPTQTFAFTSTKEDIVAVRIQINSNYGDPNYSGLSEVRFEQVPEPSSVSLLGLGCLFLFRRRR